MGIVIVVCIQLPLLQNFLLSAQVANWQMHTGTGKGLTAKGTQMWTLQFSSFGDQRSQKPEQIA